MKIKIGKAVVTPGPTPGEWRLDVEDGELVDGRPNWVDLPADDFDSFVETLGLEDAFATMGREDDPTKATRSEFTFLPMREPFINGLWVQRLAHPDLEATIVTSHHLGHVADGLDVWRGRWLPGEEIPREEAEALSFGEWLEKAMRWAFERNEHPVFLVIQ